MLIKNNQITPAGYNFLLQLVQRKRRLQPDVINTQNIRLEFRLDSQVPLDIMPADMQHLLLHTVSESIKLVEVGSQYHELCTFVINKLQ